MENKTVVAITGIIALMLGIIMGGMWGYDYARALNNPPQKYDDLESYYHGFSDGINETIPLCKEFYGEIHFSNGLHWMSIRNST